MPCVIHCFKAFDELPNPQKSVISSLGDVIFTGKVGSGKALDYAVVDFYMMNLICFLNGLGMVDKEGVSPELLLDCAENRICGIVATLRSQLKKMRERNYKQDLTASISTWKQFFESRMDFLSTPPASNQRMALFVSSLLSNGAVSGSQDEYINEDILRLQELLRFNNEPQGRTSVE